MDHDNATATATSAAVASASASGKVAKKLSPSKIYQNKFIIYHWYMVAAVCAFFAILQVGSMVLHRRRRLAIVKARSVAPVSEKDDFATKPASSGGALAAPLALKATIWKTMIWREFTVGMWSSSSSEMFWSVGYTLAMLVFGFIYIPMGDDATPKSQASMYANRCGRLAFAQMPLIVGLASKNNVISFVTGISYEKLNFLHRSSSRACLILSWAHSIGRSVPIALQKKNSLGHLHMQMGVVALAAFTILTLLSFKPFLRHMAYEAFLISHIVLALLFLIGSYMHWEEYGMWVWPSFLIWGLDRFVRLGKTIFLNKLWLSFSSKTGAEERTAVVESLHGGALRVTLPRSMRWTPGQHAYLVCPTVSRFRSSPSL
ncbi:hypothetical protein BDY24DRAFT_417348 [Mrakia frigida]|uniref:ferredoxin reductase family protein n=1 Tax=Mrakia frigida TaxID=29902 RepID=UPI003FCC1E44